jgi:hypothetical protein
MMVVAGLLLGTGTARADYVYQFADSSGNVSSNFSVAVGSTVSIEVFITQTGSTTGLSATGLNQGGVAVTGYSTSTATVPNTSAITPNDSNNGGPFNPAFTSTNVSGNTASVQVGLASGGVMAPTSGANANRILLGTFTFTGVSAGVTNVVTTSPNPGSNVNILADGTVIDPVGNVNAVINVTAVPEPSTFVLAGLLATGIAGAAWRRSHRRVAAA